MIRQKKISKLVSILFLVISLFSCSIFLLVEAEYEPNNSFADADYLENDYMVGTISGQFDDDYWRVECASNSELVITMVNDNEYFALEIYDSEYTKIHSFEVIFKGTVEVIDIDTGGWHYIKILHNLIFPAPRDYQFLVEYLLVEQLEWDTPASGFIEFPPPPDNDSALFSFSYYQQSLSRVELLFNGTSYGNFIDPEYNVEKINYVIPFSEEINGNVTAELVGYISDVEVARKARNFTFAKLKFVEYEILDQGVEFLGNKLYSILYDPNGDWSFSGWKEGSTFSLGVGTFVTETLGIGVSTKQDYKIFSGEASLVAKETTEEGYDFRFVTTEIAEIRSGFRSDSPDEIGPGYGDYYWGEAWYIPWKLAAVHKIDWEDNETWREPEIVYGINRTSSALINHAHAPEEWRNQSLYPDYPHQNVTWIHTQVVSGGGGQVNYWEQFVTTEAVYHATTIEFGVQASFKIWKLPKVTVSFNTKTKVYRESGEEYSMTRYYSISDNDQSDIIVNDIGYDRRFGTFVFRTSDACFTSNPLEHNTVDYQQPVVYTPSIAFDSSEDGLSPCENDEPIVVVEIADEGGIQQAWINYTINDGASWSHVVLIEQVGNPGFWEGQIPSQEHGTSVQWYVGAKDLNDQITEKMDVHGNPFSYTVINRAPDIELASPVGGETYTGNEVTINWTSTDPDEDDLTYSLAYNFNNHGWHSFVTGLTNTSYNWDITSIDFVDNVQIRVTAYDGYGGEAMDMNEDSFAIKRIPTNANGFYLPSLIMISVLALALTVRIIRKRR